MTNYVRFFDTTLRDGEQSPGATLTSSEKLEVARQLARLGVDIIEAGFTAASPDDLAAVQGIANEIGREDSLTKLGEDYKIYIPRMVIKKYKKNKIINKELNLLGDYLYCFHN